MIIKGGAAGNVGWWTAHLQRDDTNERAELVEVRGLLSDNLADGLREMQAIASQSRGGKNFMYQANINPDQELTPEQWQQAIDKLEKKLGFEGHQRIVYEHQKVGEDGDSRTHRHVIWSRVDVDTLKVRDTPFNYRTHMETARELENEFSHTPTPQPPVAERNPKQLWEVRAAERTGIEPDDIKAEATTLWRESTNGQEFREAIEGRGYILAAGDRRDFCLVDTAGTTHSLARRLDGVKAQDVRAHMADVDRDSLPTVTEARQMQRERYAEQQRAEAIKTAPNVVEVAPDQLARREAKAERDQAQWQEKRTAEVERVTERGEGHSTPLSVAGTASGMAMPMVDFVLGILAGGGPTPEPPGPMAEIRAQQRATAALERMQESMERGENLRPDDLRSLTPTHLENIKSRGDEYLRQLIEDLQQEEVRRQQRELER